MKKIIFCCLTFICALNLYSQSVSTSQNGINSVFDRFGNKTNLSQITVLTQTDAPVPGAKAAPVTSCSAGYFNVFFAQGSGMEGGSIIETLRRNVVCQVLTDVSLLINSPLQQTPGTPKVNILIDNISLVYPGVNMSQSDILGVGSSYYAEIINNSTAGLTSGEVWKTIHLGNDSYTNVGPIYMGQNFYHGYMAFNFQNAGIDYFTDLNSTNIGASQSDLYTLVLHEFSHVLGLVSFMKDQGQSIISPDDYYTLYDAKLKDKFSNPLIVGQTPGCGMYNYSFNSQISSSVLSPACPTNSVYPLDVTSCPNAIVYSGSVNLPVFTPGCYEDGASLSHLEDYCYAPTSFSQQPPASNNLYFVSSNIQMLGASSLKRYWKPEERLVLCDLGYKIEAINASTVAGANFNYSTITCQGIDVAGLNDGVVNGVFQFITSTGTQIAINGINNNDYNAVGFECLEHIYSPGGTPGVLNVANGTSLTSILFTPNWPGINVLRYVPVSANGGRGNITYIYVYSTPNYSLCSADPCNMVTNGRFDLKLYTPTGFSEISAACGWSSANLASPDFLHPSAQFPVSVPCNSFGYENDNLSSNSGYAGIHCGNDNYNEIIYTKLSSPLQPNTVYNLTFDVSLAEGGSIGTNSVCSLDAPLRSVWITLSSQ